MKKVTLAALMLVPAIGFAQTGFTVNAKFSGANPPTKAYLMYGNTVDSAVLKNGSFQFTGKVNSAINAQVAVDKTGLGLEHLGNDVDLLSIYLENEVININTVDSIKNAVIKGSKINDEFAKYKTCLTAVDKQLDLLNAEYAAAPAEKQSEAKFREALTLRYTEITKQKAELQKEYIKKNPASFISFNALKEIAGGNLDVAVIEPIYKGLSENIRNSDAGKGFAQQIESAKSTAIGVMAPDFTQNDVNDKPVKLSDFKGKYVLIDFWASWCGPCRAENPNVVNAYNQYKDKNFTILGVSLDQGNKDKWMEAIKADGLTWTQISDLKGWKNAAAALYGVRGIPQNYLVDPTGKIIAKNLRGQDLNKKLKEILGS